MILRAQLNAFSYGDVVRCSVAKIVARNVRNVLEFLAVVIDVLVVARVVYDIQPAYG